MLKRRVLLGVDGVINLSLGIGLVLFPQQLVTALGIPEAESAFYPNVLGAVLIGIGVALLVERSRPPHRWVGLGLAGAVAINLCAGVVLGGWLLFGRLHLPMRGVVFLWALVVILIGLSGVELMRQARDRENAG